MSTSADPNHRLDEELIDVPDHQCDQDDIRPLLKPDTVPYSTTELTSVSVAEPLPGLDSIDVQPFDPQRHDAHLRESVLKGAFALLGMVVILSFADLAFGDPNSHRAVLDLAALLLSPVSGCLGYAFGHSKGART